MSSAHSTSFWRNDGLSLWIRLGFAGLSLIGWMLMAWLGFWVLCLTRFACNHNRTRHFRLVAHALCSSLLIVIANLYIACWCFYWRLGVFPDADGIYFAGLNAGMLFRYFWQAERHVVWSSLAAFVLISSTCIVAVTYAFRRCLEHRARNGSLLIPGMVLVVVGWNAMYYLMNDARGPDRRRPSPRGRIEAVLKPWASCRFELRYHVNPLVTLATTACGGSESVFPGEIPLDHLTPLGSFNPQVPNHDVPDEQPNIVLITVESLRSDAILKVHQGQQVMPHTAALARTGRFLPNCYANSTHSDYSDPAILSSLYPLRSQRPHYYSRSDPWPKVLIYDILKEYEFATAFVSSQNEAWSNMHLFYDRPSLDLFFDSRSYVGETIAEQGYLSYWMSETGQIAGKLDDSITVSRAIDWVRSCHAAQTPFFLSINLQSSHFPYERPDGARDPFQPSEIDFEVSLLEYPPEKVSNLQNAYYNALNYADSQIQRLTTCLDELGLRERTVLLITGDHGEAFLEVGVAGHAGIPLETTTKVGLVVHCPGLVEPAVDDYLAQSIDIPPTILGFLGGPECAVFQGTDVLNSGRSPQEDRLIYIHCNNAITSYDAVVSGTGWKHIYDFRQEQAALYYRPTDLEPHENLIPREAEVAEILQRLGTNWRQQQILYYTRPRYYLWFCPPDAPELSTPDRHRMLEAGRRRRASIRE